MKTDKQLKLGANLTFAAGIIPFLFGLITVFFNWYSYLNPDEAFRAIMPPGAKAAFTFNQVMEFSRELGIELISAKHIHYSILMAIGILIMTLAYNGLRNRLKWSWWVLVATILLVGWNDGFTSLSFGMLPFPFFPAVLATIGLIIARKPIFSHSS